VVAVDADTDNVEATFAKGVPRAPCSEDRGGQAAEDRHRSREV